MLFHVFGCDLDTFQVGQYDLEPACHFGLAINIFGPLDAWKGQKWPQVMLSHVFGCDMAHCNQPAIDA